MEDDLSNHFIMNEAEQDPDVEIKDIAADYSQIQSSGLSSECVVLTGEDLELIGEATGDTVDRSAATRSMQTQTMKRTSTIPSSNPNSGCPQPLRHQGKQPSRQKRLRSADSDDEEVTDIGRDEDAVPCILVRPPVPQNTPSSSPNKQRESPQCKNPAKRALVGEKENVSQESFRRLELSMKNITSKIVRKLASVASDPSKTNIGNSSADPFQSYTLATFKPLSKSLLECLTTSRVEIQNKLTLVEDALIFRQTQEEEILTNSFSTDMAKLLHVELKQCCQCHTQLPDTPRYMFLFECHSNHALCLQCFMFELVKAMNSNSEVKCKMCSRHYSVSTLTARWSKSHVSSGFDSFWSAIVEEQHHPHQAAEDDSTSESDDD